MLSKFWKLFSAEVETAITDGADAGVKQAIETLDKAELARRTEEAVVEGVEAALNGLHKLLSREVKPKAARKPAKAAKPAKAHTNGKLPRNRLNEVLSSK